MTAVAPIRFKYNAKTYWFTYDGEKPAVGDFVLVSRDGGQVFGWVEDEPFELTDEQERAMKSPLKPIDRVATPDDLEKKEELEQRGLEAKEVFRELAAKRELDIKPIDVEYLLGTDKAIFHFSSEERVDFRELVRDLASRLHVHVDMKQIGVRDEARLLGGLGHCGEMLCCVRMSSAFQPVSIKMAKEQDLPLNPTKVSGACGRLMCCLRYEYEAYKDFKSRAPKVNAAIETPAGKAKVVELNTPKELVKLKMEETGEPFVVPLASLEKDPENEQGRPCRIGEEEFAQHCPASMMRERAFEIPKEELLESDSEKQGRRKRKKGGQKKASGEQGGQKQEPRQQGEEAEGQPKPKSRRRGGRGRKPAAQQGEGQQQQQAKAGQPKAEGQAKAKQRPGQNSSNIQNPQDRQGGEQKPKSGSRRRRGGGHRQQGEGGQNAAAKKEQQGQQGQHSRPQAGKQEGGGQSRRRRPRRTSGGQHQKPEGPAASE